MQGPFYATRAYMYGNLFFDNEVPYYNSTKYHRKPGPREYPDHRQFDDNSEYREDIPDGTPELVRGVIAPILNSETWIERRLHIVLYGMTEEEDKEYILDIGKRYAIQYVTEQGIKSADGYLRVISNSVPDTNCRYANNTSDEALQAWIGMDCSKTGVSDKRRIYINAIRAVTPLENDEDYVEPQTSDSMADLIIKIWRKVRELENCDCKAIDEQILAIVQELKESGVELKDLDLNGDGVISQEELDANGEPLEFNDIDEEL